MQYLQVLPNGGGSPIAEIITDDEQKIEAFKAQHNKPGQGVFRCIRIDLACELLRRSDLPISEIAYAVGFSSQSHLTTNFRHTTGVTPRKFRESLN